MRSFSLLLQLIQLKCIQILKNLWIPPATFIFPILDFNAKRGLKFQHHWLNTYNWLAYSEKYQGAFCKYCVAFSRIGGVGGQKLGTLVLEAFTNYKKATDVCIFIKKFIKNVIYDFLIIR